MLGSAPGVSKRVSCRGGDRVARREFQVSSTGSGKRGMLGGGLGVSGFRETSGEAILDGGRAAIWSLQFAAQLVSPNQRFGETSWAANWSD